MLAPGKTLAERPGATAGDLNEYAWELLTVEPSGLRDPVVALSFAKRAVEMTNGKDANILDPLAEAYHLTGDHVRAVETQERAAALLKPDSSRRGEFEERLAKFKAAPKANAASSK